MRCLCSVVFKGKTGAKGQSTQLEVLHIIRIVYFYYYYYFVLALLEAPCVHGWYHSNKNLTPQFLCMESQMVLHERGNEEVTMIVPFLHAHGHFDIFVLSTGGNKCLWQQLAVREEIIGSALIA